MKTLMILTTLLLIAQTGQAQMAPDNVITVETHTIKVDVSTAKMKLSAADYSAPTVKVLIPELARITILDHRNTNEAAPCMATFDTLNPEDVIQNNPGFEEVPITVIRTVQKWPDQISNRCRVWLNESVETNIRGFYFTHDEMTELPNRHIDDCI